MIPRRFAQTILELFGAAGAEWLECLPGLIAGCELRWGITVQAPFEPLSYNYVAPAVGADGAHLVLKLCYLNPELLTEIAALRFYAGCGVVRLLDADPERGILLLERLEPGMPLSQLNDDVQATSIAAQVMQQFWHPAPLGTDFPTTEKWARGLERLRRQFNGGTGPFSPRLVETAEALFKELHASSAAPVLLHGDLHQDNILSAERQSWLALDPKGVIGEPAYEVGAMLHNIAPQFLAEQHPAKILRRRVDQLSEELGFDRQRLRDWGTAQAVLSAWWSYEDHGHGWEWAISCAEWLMEISG